MTTLKIICLEEHFADAELTAATQPILSKSFPYMSGLGTLLEENPAMGPQHLPSLQGPSRAEQLAAASIETRLSDMDENKIDVQVLSSTKLIQMLPPREAVELAREANNRLAEMIAKHSNRFAAFAALPWQDPGAAASELERAVKELGFVGALLAGSPAPQKLIDYPLYSPILAQLETLDVPLYVHPGPPLSAVQQSYYAGFNGEVTARLSLFGWGWHNEAGIQIIRLMLSGVFDRHPNLRVISGHWGEMVPFFLPRLDETLPPAATGLKRTISQTYREHVFVTPSGMLNQAQFQFIKEIVGIDRILFSVDYPYMTLTGARSWLESLPISEIERSAIAHVNAEQLLRLRR